MKKLAILMVALGLVFVAACGSGGGSDEGASPTSAAGSPTASPSASQDTNKEPVTIRITLSEGELTPEMIKEFETANPDIKIQREDTDPTKLAAQLATADAPDIIRVSGVNELASYVIRGVALDLTAYFEKSSVIKMDDLLPVANVYRFDGKTQGKGPIYGLPKDWSPDFTLWYNKKLFDAAGVPVPDASKPLTWSEVFALAKKLTIREGANVTQYGLVTSGKTEADIPTLMQYLASKGVRVYSEDFSQANFNIPEVKEMLNLWIEAVKGNYGPNQINQDQVPWGGDAFFKDKAALMVQGYWVSGGVRNDENMKTHAEDYVMLPAPIADGGNRVSPPGEATGAILNKNSEHPDEAWRVFEWYFGGKPAEDRAKGGWGVPVQRSYGELLPKEGAFDRKVFETLQAELEYGGQYLEVNPYAINVHAVFSKHMTPVYFGKSSLDEALEKINTDINVMIKEGMAAAGN